MELQAELDRLRVLVVDDNHHMIKIVKTILRGFGVKQLVEARDAAEAFNQLRTGFVNLIIVDYQMSLLDGVEFVRMVRSGRDVPNPNIPIIMLTAYSDKHRVMAARDAGVTEFCCKPVTATELWLKLSACVARPRGFVRAGGFSGPDRRRRKNGYAGTDRRGSRAEGGGRPE
jgi:CheY-like chemotaxis protein